MASLAFFSASPRRFEFFDCETEIKTPDHSKMALSKNRDCEMYRTAQKQDCETREI